MDRVFRLSAGQVGPLQQSAVSCGAACLVVARMLRDPEVSRWVIEGDAGDGRSPSERFAELERRTMRRTNAVVSRAGRLQAPWPRSLGTPPWGAAAELENGGADAGVGYRVIAVRGLGRDGLGRTYDDVLGRVRPGEPVLGYVGSDVLPRHVVLFFAGQDRTVLTYEPSSGAVDLPSRHRFATARLGLGGWNRPWFLVAPEPDIPVAARRRARLLAPAPLPRPGALTLRQYVDLAGSSPEKRCAPGD